MTNRPPTAAATVPSAEQIAARLDELACGLDALLVGQEQAKEALLLGWMTGRHVLLEGPPGCGKSRLAERGLRHLWGAGNIRLLSFHRDLRAEEFFGDAVLRRQRRGASERIRVEFERRGLLDAAGWVLDDLDRAPGEALAPLLHLLSRRRLRRGADDLHAARLHLAVATATLVDGEPGEGASNPLEPAQLDRFALQVCLRGLIQSRRWVDCRRLITIGEEGAASGAKRPRSAEGSTRAEGGEDVEEVDPVALLPAVTNAVRAVTLPPGVVAAMQEVLGRLAESARRAAQGGTSGGPWALLSDGGLVAALPSLVRAHALRHGRGEARVDDLAVLRLMVAHRIAPTDHATLDDLLAQALAEEGRRGDRAPLEDSGAPQQGMPLGADDEEAPPVAQVEAATPNVAPGAEGELPTPELPPRRPRVRSVDVAPLVRAFEGVLDQGRADLDDDPGGSPRGLRRMRRFDELLDADPLETAMLVDGRLADLPRVFRRRRHTLGGAVIVARDVSSSMAGFRNDWASEVVCGLLRAANRRRMRVGYIEFHQRAMAKRVGGRLLHRGVRELERIVRDAVPLGQTNYEAPLDMALDALRARRGSERHVVLLTDGLPILGDTLVRRERALARKLGVRLHTVFIGDGDCPVVLDDISRETDGLRFQAIEQAVGGRFGLEIVRRAGTMAPPQTTAPWPSPNHR